jgi:hypothetical protein
MAAAGGRALPASQTLFHRIDPRTDHPGPPAIAAWAGHIAAGRIGTPPPRDAALAAIHAANAALLVRRRREARA